MTGFQLEQELSLNMNYPTTYNKDVPKNYTPNNNYYNNNKIKFPSNKILNYNNNLCKGNQWDLISNSSNNNKVYLLIPFNNLFNNNNKAYLCNNSILIAHNKVYNNSYNKDKHNRICKDYYFNNSKMLYINKEISISRAQNMNIKV